MAVPAVYELIPRVMGDLQSGSDIGPRPDDKVLAEGVPFLFCVQVSPCQRPSGDGG